MNRKTLEVVGEAENGFAAIELLEKGLESDIILTDFNMPGMDGAVLSEKVHVVRPHLKTIILTMHQRADFVDRAAPLAHQDIFLKMAILMSFISESEMCMPEKDLLPLDCNP